MAALETLSITSYIFICLISKFRNIYVYLSAQCSHSVVSDSLQPQRLKHARLPIHHQILEPTQTHVHPVGYAIQQSHLLSSPSHSNFNLSQHRGPFSMSAFFTLGDQSIGVSASALVFQMNVQD